MQRNDFRDVQQGFLKKWGPATGLLLDIICLGCNIRAVWYRFDVFDNNVFSTDFLTRQVYPCWNKINKRANYYAETSWAGVYFTLWTHQIDFNSYMCLQGGTTAIHKISNIKTLLALCKYAKNVNFCSPYALVDGSLESGTPCWKEYHAWHHARKSICMTGTQRVRFFTRA